MIKLRVKRRSDSRLGELRVSSNIYNELEVFESETRQEKVYVEITRDSKLLVFMQVLP